MSRKLMEAEKIFEVLSILMWQPVTVEQINPDSQAASCRIPRFGEVPIDDMLLKKDVLLS